MPPSGATLAANLRNRSQYVVGGSCLSYTSNNLPAAARHSSFNLLRKSSPRQASPCLQSKRKCRMMSVPSAVYQPVSMAYFRFAWYE